MFEKDMFQKQMLKAKYRECRKCKAICFYDMNEEKGFKYWCSDCKHKVRKKRWLKSLKEKEELVVDG